MATASTASTTVAISPSSDSSNASSIVPSSSSTTTAPPNAESSFIINSTATCQSVSVNYVSPGLPEQCLRTRSTASQDTLRRDEATPSPAIPTESASPPGTLEETQLSTEGSSVSSESPTIIVPPPPPPSPPLKIPDDPPQPPEQPLDTAVFLSFEEWKNQNLAKVGQSSDSFTQREQRGGPAPVQGAHHASLDGLGDEIEIDFGFGSAGSPANTIQVSGSQATGTAKPSTAMPRSKDAGKTCKERFNYASLDCAATVHRHNKEIKGAHAILMENKESYMLNKCEAKEKFFIVELCEDILVDTVVLANFEFFSSVFKEIRVSVSDTYPVKTNGWKELGTYVARNTRDVQAFLVENPLIWARYLKVEILSHYGNEYYCPISLLRVHGTTMMEEFRHESSQRGGEDDVREDIRPEAVAEPVKSAEAEEEAQQQEDNRNSIEAIPTAPIILSEPENTLTITVVEDLTATPSVTAETATRVTATTCYDPWELMNRRYIFPMELPTCPRYISVSPTPMKASTALTQPASQEVPGPIGMYPTETASTATGSTAIPAAASSASSALIPKEPPVVRSIASHIQEPVKPSYITPPIAVPTTQESFFKSVHKRLTGLESNSTLTLQYIEEQSRLMRDTFTKMEKAHVAKMEKLLESVNASAFSDLAAYREKYDQLWQSTVLALESHRLLSEREMLAISTRLTFLADEVIFQKRMYQLNTLLLVITIGVVIFSRNDRLAMPLGRHLRTHSNISNIRIFESPPQSPMPQVRKKRSDSDDSSIGGGSMPGSVVGSPGGSNGPRMMSPPASREGSPAVEEVGLSPGSLPASQGSQGSQLAAGSGNKHAEKGSERRKSWVYGFGPKLKPEGRGRMFKRQPSPLIQGEPGPAVYEGEEVGGT
ncbi:Similar to Uncharacterized protein SLP1; acc. no. Q12232 [Pyronema omphalodes CBS 100304]|uniref:SUN-like protein 1 n=1 Tax=Pyronema omphalodes (strain CBS 100304) TaxID=1076935 RepID=U4L4Q4_PYROM|nr:Similar to Uncharacterized protein SLP1; acc. no. Q12232 [Pyronema omphalodes CBS 100304]